MRPPSLSERTLHSRLLSASGDLGRHLSAGRGAALLTDKCHRDGSVQRASAAVVAAVVGPGGAWDRKPLITEWSRARASGGL